MAQRETTFSKLVRALETHYGPPPPPPASDPLELILYESIGYLCDDDRRQAAFAALREQVGLKPAEILAAPIKSLVAIAKLGGIQPEIRARRLKEIALIVLNEFDGDLRNAVALPVAQAIRALKKFPSIADPGAEKILLFTRTYPRLGLESNGLRVLLRLGFGQENKNYSTSYRSVRAALADQMGDDCDFLIKANQLLRQHGKQLCKTNVPDCPSCPLMRSCAYYSAH